MFSFTGVKVVLLNCLHIFTIKVMEQALRLGMTGPGWAWLITDTDGIVQVLCLCFKAAFTERVPQRTETDLLFPFFNNTIQCQ